MTAIVARWRSRARSAPSRPAVVPVVLVLMVAGFAVAAGILFVRWQSARAADSARSAAVGAAQRQVPALLSYSYQSFASDLAHAEADTAPQFRSTYAKLMTGQVEPAAMRNHVVTTSAVTGTAVESADSGGVTLLMFVSQQTKTDAKQESVLNDTAVRVTMREVSGAWLVAGLTPRS